MKSHICAINHMLLSKLIDKVIKITQWYRDEKNNGTRNNVPHIPICEGKC